MSDLETRLDRHRQREAGLSALLDIARELSASSDLDTLLKTLTRRARLLLGADMSFVALFDEHGDPHVRAADGNIAKQSTGLRLPHDPALGGSNLGPAWTADHPAEEWFAHSTIIDEVVRHEDLRAVLAAPLTDGAQAVGTLYLADREVRRFTPDEISLTSTLGDLAGTAVAKTRLLTRACAEAAALRARLADAEAGLNALRELADTRSRLVELVLTGGDLHTLAEEASHLLDGAVRIAAVDNTVLAAAGKTIAAGPLPPTTVDAHATGAPVPLGDGLWAAPILAGDEDLGTLTLRPRHGFTGDDEARLRAVAQTAAILLRTNRVTGTDNRAREALFDEFLSDPARSPRLLERRARRLGIHLDTPHVVVMVRADEIGRGRAAYWSSSYTYRKNGLCNIRGGRVALLVPGTDPAAVTGEVTAELSRLLGHPVTVAISQPVSDAGAVAHAYQEAARYLDAMAALGITGSAASARELGFLGVLLSDNHDVDGFVRGAIGPVLDYDRERNTDLVRTLEAYFDTGSSPTYAAEKLHVHPNTVTRRLDRISELLGPDWQKPERALDIQVALRVSRIRHVLRDRRAPAPPGQDT
ncbi:helix-turn-helix domain-containing protein [Actinophytocola sp. KF-1]